jgi:dihydrodipicolinate synthase/N-acetylneuraminate lyase
MEVNRLSQQQKDMLQSGIVIPAHPLALNAQRKIDKEKQRRLTRYYMASGAGGIAIGVHTTQFEIRDPKINLYETVLQLASEEIEKADLHRPFLKVAGICGPTPQAIKEADLAVKYGYDLGLLSMGGLQDWTEEQLLERAKIIADIIPVFGFYLQPAAGGRILSYDFWRQFVEIGNVEAIKVAAFNRYQTLDVMRAVVNSSRRDSIAMYTGNDDNIIADLLTVYRFTVNGQLIEKRFSGGLLGHWAVWTKKAVDLLEEIKEYHKNRTDKGAGDLLRKGIAVTDMNTALFDPSHGFHGCIAGIHEVLRRQGLLEGRWCLDPKEDLSLGQMEEINRIYKDYPELNDDDFVKEFITSEP